MRGNFYKYRKFYSKQCKIAHRKFKNTMIEKLNGLYEKNPSEYWKLLDNLKNENRENNSSAIDSDEWVNHFENLNTIPPKFSERLQNIKNVLCSAENEGISFSSLDYMISKAEILKAMKTLKNGKATGLDCISNEMLRHCDSYLLPCIHKIFNNILSNGSYPSKWKLAYMTPVYKRSGSIYDSNNYRGIAILNCTAKLFNSVLNNRLDIFFRTKQCY